jgi:hypothetical protein
MGSVLLTTDETDIPGGVVHDLPGDLRDALKARSKSTRNLASHYASGAKRMDLLDPIRKEVRDEAETYRVELLKPERWEAPSLLLAGMPPSRGPTGFIRPPSIRHSSVAFEHKPSLRPSMT